MYYICTIYIDVKIVDIHFLFVFLVGAGGDTSDDLPGPGLALPGAEGVISLLLRFGGATGAGAGSDTEGFNVAAAAETRSITELVIINIHWI